MNLFGIGPLEAVFFILIMLIILGPADMVKVGRTLGTTLRKLWTSPTWRMIFTASDTLRKLPTTLVREAGVEELRQDLQRETDSLKKMGREMTEFNIPKTVSPKTPPPVSSPETSDFPGWTTPLEPVTKLEEVNSILPPRLSKPHPYHPPKGEPPISDESPSEPQ
jgi:Sec-independent protein translocase protein TatA